MACQCCEPQDVETSHSMGQKSEPVSWKTVAVVAFGVVAVVCTFRALVYSSEGVCPLHRVQLDCPECTSTVSLKGTYVKTKPKLVLFGDSITERGFFPEGGWAATIAHTYSRQLDVVVRGFGGYNTRWALQIAGKIFSKATNDVALATVFFGANDASLPSQTSGRQHVPLAEYRSNLEAMVTHLRSLAQPPRILLITPPPIHEDARIVAIMMRTGRTTTEKIAPERTNEQARLYADVVVEVGKSLGVPVLDLHKLIEEQECWTTSMLSDGLHLSSGGNKVLAQAVLQIIADNWPELRPERLAMLYPAWDAIDPEDVAGSLA